MRNNPDKPSLVVALLVLLPAAAVSSGLALIAVSLSSRGVADGVGYHAWTPAAGGVIFATPLLLAGLISLSEVWRRTHRPFEVRTPHIYLGALGLLLWIAIAWAYVLLIGRPSTYEGAFNPVTQRFDPMFSERAFFLTTALIALVYPTVLFIAAAKFLFIGSIREPQLRAVAGFDPIGEIARHPN